MAGRGCIRGCTVRDVHFATCPWFGLDDDQAAAKREASTDAPCGGCAPVVAREESLLCEGCYKRLRRLLGDTADLIGHLRSLADPTKAAVYDRVQVSSSRPELPAPVPADLIDASNDLMRMLRDWAVFVDPQLAGRRGLAAGAETAEAFDQANVCLQVVLADFDWLANRTEIRDLADAVLHRHVGEPQWWSVVDALAKWPLDDQPRWAKNPCPECDCKTVRVRPPRRTGDPASYRCTTCDWESDDRAEDGFWAEAFAELVPEVEAAA
ncbi:MAG: hypothetical protein FJW64_04035 [Actinobacteria bacterium]|nr:hypothetical protein [Actinomycetota bacterium]